MTKCMTEDTDEEMSLVVVCTGTGSPGNIEDILERQRVKFWFITRERGTGEVDANKAYHI